MYTLAIKTDEWELKAQKFTDLDIITVLWK